MAKTKKVVRPPRDQLLAPETNFLVRWVSPESAAFGRDGRRPATRLGGFHARMFVVVAA
jgi:hypothetical protein